MEETPAKDTVNSQASVNMEAWLLSERILTASQAELARREGTRLGLVSVKLFNAWDSLLVKNYHSFDRFVAN